MLVDSHCHLDGPRFDADRRAALERAYAAGVEAVLAIGNGAGPADAGCALALAKEFHGSGGIPRIYASLGVHPHEAKLATDADFENMRALAQDPAIVAWGEIGLDYHYDHSPRGLQRDVFIRQMRLAIEAHLPIVIHCRPSEADPNDAWDDCLALIERYFAPSGLPGVLHCFTGQWEHAQAALSMNFCISFAGNLTFPKAQQIRDCAVKAPAGRILVETDSPYLAPVPHRGQRNEPAFVIETARHLATLRNAPIEDLARDTTANFYRLFAQRSRENPRP